MNVTTVNAARARMQPRPPAPLPKMTIKRGKVNGPRRFLIYGQEGVGKTTFVASAEKPVIIDAEIGSEEIGTDRLECDTWEEVLASIQLLIDDPHDYKTVGVDSLDKIEPWVEKYVVKMAGKKSISDFEWGGGHREIQNQWREFISRLETLQRKRGMHVVLIAHSTLKESHNPDGEDVSRYVIKLAEKTRQQFYEWVKLLGFASYEQVVTVKKGKRAKAKSTGARILQTQHRASFDAKNRYRLPFKMPLDWNEVFNSTMVVFNDESPEEKGALYGQIAELNMKLRDAEKQAAVAEWLEDKNQSVANLTLTLNKLTVLISEQGDDEDNEDDQQEQE